MFSSEDIKKIKDILKEAGLIGKREDESDHDQNCKNKKNQKNNPKEVGRNDSNLKECFNLTPSQLLVIAGFLTGVLEVNSVLVSKEQVVEIVLSGTLKRKTELEKVMEQIGQLPFDEVIKAIISNSV